MTLEHFHKKIEKLSLAEHPYRQTAIHIIEEIIEPLLCKRGDDDGLNGEEYYKVEDDIVALLDSYLK